MVNPGGTGSPMRHISARFAPLPPSNGFIVPFPSVLRPKKYTYLPCGGRGAGREARGAGFLPAVFLAITFAVLLSEVRGPRSDTQCTFVVGRSFSSGFP